MSSDDEDYYDEEYENKKDIWVCSRGCYKPKKISVNAKAKPTAISLSHTIKLIKRSI
jgi:hypothetical protein